VNVVQKVQCGSNSVKCNEYHSSII